MHLEQREDQAAAVALLLAGQLLEESFGPHRGEELEDLGELGPLVRLFGELLQLIAVERLAEPAPHELDGPRIDLLLGRQALGELEHGDRLRQRAFVEALDAGLDHLLEAAARLDRIVRILDDAAHRAERPGLGRRRSGRGGSRRGGHRRHHPARQRLGKGAKDVADPGLQAQILEALEIRLELLTRLRAARRVRQRFAGAGRLRRGGLRWRRAAGAGGGAAEGHGRGAADAAAPPPVRPPCASRRSSRSENRCNPRTALSEAPASPPAAPPPPEEPAPPADAEALARGPLPSVGAWRKMFCACETAAGASPSRPRFSSSIARSSCGQSWRMSGPQAGEVNLERLARHEVELGHHVDLLERVVQVVRNRHGRGGAPPVLAAGPRADGVGHDVGRILHQQLHRVRHDQRSDRVGQILMQLDEGLVELRVGWLPAHFRLLPAVPLRVTQRGRKR